MSWKCSRCSTVGADGLPVHDVFLAKKPDSISAMLVYGTSSARLDDEERFETGLRCCHWGCRLQRQAASVATRAGKDSNGSRIAASPTALTPLLTLQGAQR
jgi:hypothetical protein